MKTHMYYFFAGIICVVVGIIYIITGIGYDYDVYFSFLFAFMFFILDELNDINSKLNEPKPPQQD